MTLLATSDRIEIRFDWSVYGGAITDQVDPYQVLIDAAIRTFLAGLITVGLLEEYVDAILRHGDHIQFHLYTASLTIRDDETERYPALRESLCAT